jgi:hypothetical protein
MDLSKYCNKHLVSKCEEFLEHVSRCYLVDKDSSLCFSIAYFRYNLESHFLRSKISFGNVTVQISTVKLRETCTAEKSAEYECNVQTSRTDINTTDSKHPLR